MSTEPAKTCAGCGFWSKWMPSTGDCLHHTYMRRHEIVEGKPSVREGRAAECTDASDTCGHWAPLADVRRFVDGAYDALYSPPETTA